MGTFYFKQAWAPFKLQQSSLVEEEAVVQEMELAVLASRMTNQLGFDECKEEVGQAQSFWAEQNKAFLAQAESESLSDDVNLF